MEKRMKARYKVQGSRCKAIKRYTVQGTRCKEGYKVQGSRFKVSSLIPWTLYLVPFLLSGCISAQVDRSTDKEKCTASATSMFMSLSGVQMSACHARSSADQTQVDIDALISVLQALKRTP